MLNFINLLGFLRLLLGFCRLFSLLKLLFLDFVVLDFRCLAIYSCELINFCLFGFDLVGQILHAHLIHLITSF